MEKPLGDIVKEITSLAKKNKFKDIIKFLSDLAYKYEKSPRRLIAVLTMRIYYNMQINANQAVVSDFNMIKSPYSEKWMYESYPDKYSDRKGSMCPFSLYLLYAYYPYLVGSAYTALDRFYTLWDHLQQHKGDSPESLEIFVSRAICITLLIADIFLCEQRPLDALSTLRKLHIEQGIRNHATDAMMAVVYNMIGDTMNAKKHIEHAIEAPSPFTDYYRAIQSAINGDYETAHNQFTACQASFEAQETSNVVASYENMLINNKVVALFYMNRIVAAKITIEKCCNLFKSARLFKGIIWNSTMLKELAVDIDTSYLDEESS